MPHCVYLHCLVAFYWWYKQLKSLHILLLWANLKNKHHYCLFSFFVENSICEPHKINFPIFSCCCNTVQKWSNWRKEWEKSTLSPLAAEAPHSPCLRLINKLKVVPWTQRVLCTSTNHLFDNNPLLFVACLGLSVFSWGANRQKIWNTLE